MFEVRYLQRKLSSIRSPRRVLSWMMCEIYYYVNERQNLSYLINYFYVICLVFYLILLHLSLTLRKFRKNYKWNVTRFSKIE